MKNVILSGLFVLAIATTSCHYGENEAKETIERNEKYKSEKQDYSVNRAGERGRKGDATNPAPEVVSTDSAAVTK
jgi:hypothetical protein